MSVSPTSRTIICQEIFDENSIPSEEGKFLYCKKRKIKTNKKNKNKNVLEL